MSLIDITGKPLRILLNFREKAAIGPTGTDHPFSTGLLPPSAQQLIQTPLNQMIDKFWSGTKDSSNKTMRDRAGDTVIIQIQQAVQSRGETPSDVSGSFPATGTLGANAMQGKINGISRTVIFLDYALPGEIFSFNTGLAAWRLHFNADLMIWVIVPDFPGWPLTATASFNISNADITAANFAASVAEGFGQIGNFLSDQPSLFQAAEGAADQTVPAQLGDLAILLNQLTSAFGAAVTQGFLHLIGDVDAAGWLLRLIHPVDPGPVVRNATEPPVPSLQGPVLVTSQSQVKVGGQFTANGSFFTPAQATALNLQWDDTISGSIIDSDIQWRASNGSPQSASVPRNPFDAFSGLGYRHTITAVAPNTTYQVQVRDCDEFTCSDFSATPLVITTAASDEVDILLQSNGINEVVAKATLGIDGTFSALVQIPPATSLGVHPLFATTEGGQTAEASIIVLGIGQVAQPTLGVINPDTGKVLQTPPAVETMKITVRGEGFAPGQVKLAVDAGQQLGATTVPANGIFFMSVVWPFGVLGIHQIIASQVVGGTTIQTPVSVFGEKLPT